MSCSLSQTPPDQLGPFYDGRYPVTQRIGPWRLLRKASQRLEVSGRVSSASNCTLGLSDVTLEVWYAGKPFNGKYYRKNRYRGKVQTSPCGEYSFAQVFPYLYPTRPILHTHFRLSRDNVELLVTQMYFVGTGKGYVNEPTLQAVEVRKNPDGSRAVEFNFLLDLPGDCACGEACSNRRSLKAIDADAATTVASTETFENEASEVVEREPRSASRRVQELTSRAPRSGFKRMATMVTLLALIGSVMW